MRRRRINPALLVVIGLGWTIPAFATQTSSVSESLRTAEQTPEEVSTPDREETLENPTYGTDDAPLEAPESAETEAPEAEEPVGAAEEIVVTGSRRSEKVVDAPVTIERVSAKDLETAGPAFLDSLEGLKGIDFANAGINEKRISARGFNTQFNSRMLTMVDGRIATLPGNGLPQNNLLPTSSLDMKSIEVVVGPASALYGPNAHTGVINILTKDPFTDPGVSVALRGGTQVLTDGSIRVAGTINDNFGYKFNGQMFRALDFEPDRESGTHTYGTEDVPVYEGDLIEDYDVFSGKAEGTLYYRFGDDWMAKAGAGYSQNDGFSITNAGRNHIRGWEVQYQNFQLTHSNLYFQFTRTVSDAGQSYQLERLGSEVAAMGGLPDDVADLDPIRDEIKFIDKSQLYDSEIQYRENFFGMDFTTGFQARLYAPSSEGTYLADATGEDLDVTELGGYVQLDRSFFDKKLRLVAAARLDGNTNYDPQFSPKGAVVYSVAMNHNVRVGYNRAFKSPTVLENYLLLNNFLVGNRTGFEIRDPDGNVLSTIDPLSPERVDAVEVGYKGVFGPVFVDVVGYMSWYQNFISPLTQRSDPGNGQLAYYADGSQAGQPVAAGTPTEGLLFTYANFGSAQVLGIDASADVYATSWLSLSGSVSYINLLDFENDTAQPDLILNVPGLKLKGSATVRNLGAEGYFVRLSGRWQDAYEFASGRWNSNTFYADNDGKIPARLVADLTAGYTSPEGFSLTMSINNLFNNQDVDILGAPIAGTFAFLQLGYTFDGLDF